MEVVERRMAPTTTLNLQPISVLWEQRLLFPEAVPGLGLVLDHMEEQQAEPVQLICQSMVLAEPRMESMLPRLRPEPRLVPLVQLPE